VLDGSHRYGGTTSPGYSITDEIIKSDPPPALCLHMKETTPEEIFKETSSHITLSELYIEYMNKFPRKYVS
jgi:hypothetical protein